MNSQHEAVVKPAAHSPGVSRFYRDPRVIRGAIVGAVGTFLTFLVLAHDGHMPLAVPLCTLFMLATAWGILDAVDATSGVPPVIANVTWEALSTPAFRLIGSIAVFIASLWMGYRGMIPWVMTGLLLTASAIAMFACAFEFFVVLGPMAEDENGAKRVLRDRHGFWVLVAGAILYLPALGYASLWDPWETHYGEVAREIIQRDDWISTWWSWEGWFYSKPILGQWWQALAMSAMGVSTAPDKVLWDADAHHFLYPEWVVRMPMALAAIFGMYILYKGVSKHAGRRAGLIGALVLATCPQWWMLAHQSMTDMPLVASLCAAFGFVLLGLHASDEAEVRSYTVSFKKVSISISGWTLALGAIVATVLPQILYLFSRNLRFIAGGSEGFGFFPQYDEFRSGSPGNCELPDNPHCGLEHPVSNFEPALQALLWFAGLALLIVLQRRERKTKHMYYLAAWTMAGLSTMAKGPLGVCLPGCAVLLAVLMLRRWKEMPKMQIGSGLAAVALLALPWGVAFFVRRGTPFTDELLFHDMFNRVLSHVHDTNDGVDVSFRYYIWQAGYALFPWSGVVVFALISWLREPRRDSPLEMVLALWALVTFTLFAMMGTRFHHYIFPAVPAVAMLAGVALDRVLDGSKEKQDRILQAAAFVMAACFVLLIGYDLTNPAEVQDAAPGHHFQPGPSILMRLFTYQYKRVFPDFLDFGGALQFFTFAAAALLVVAGVYAWRKYMVYGLIGLAMVWAAWGLNIYMPAVSNHFGQRAVFEKYYEDRQQHGRQQLPAPPDADVVAYALNWKGENFYTGNHIAQFRTGGKPFSDWVQLQRSHHAKSVYVATEHGNIDRITDLVGGRNDRNKASHTTVSTLTTKETSEQFVLLRVDF